MVEYFQPEEKSSIYKLRYCCGLLRINSTIHPLNVKSNVIVLATILSMDALQEHTGGSSIQDKGSWEEERVTVCTVSVCITIGATFINIRKSIGLNVNSDCSPLRWPTDRQIRRQHNPTIINVNAVWWRHVCDLSLCCYIVKCKYKSDVFWTYRQKLYQTLRLAPAEKKVYANVINKLKITGYIIINVIDWALEKNMLSLML